MDGLEGLKILSESTSGQPSTIGFWITLVLFIIAGIGVLIEVNNRDLDSYLGIRMFILGFICGMITMMFSLSGVIPYDYTVKVYKVTPIEDKYFIDMDKWEIVNNEDQIITIIEKVK